MIAVEGFHVFKGLPSRRANQYWDQPLNLHMMYEAAGIMIMAGEPNIPTML